MSADPRLRARERTAFACAAVAVLMIGASFAAVPLYQLFCQITGYGGTTQVAAAAPGAVSDRVVTVRFNADIASDLPWSFRGPADPVTLRLGEERIIAYRATNTSNRTITAQATFNVTPFKVGSYFSKIECFCFTEQTLHPGESIDMPVAFFVDPALAADRNLDDIKTITLSYMMFRIAEKGAELSQAPRGAGAGRAQGTN